MEFTNTNQDNLLLEDTSGEQLYFVPHIYFNLSVYTMNKFHRRLTLLLYVSYTFFLMALFHHLHRRLVLDHNDSKYISVHLVISDTASLQPSNWEVYAVFSIFLLNQISCRYHYSSGRSQFLFTSAELL